jgi:hypothetical protein
MVSPPMNSEIPTTPSLPVTAISANALDARRDQESRPCRGGRGDRRRRDLSPAQTRALVCAAVEARYTLAA